LNVVTTLTLSNTGLPTLERFQTPIEHPLRLVLLGRDEADDVFVEPRRRQLLFEIGDKAVLVFLGLERARSLHRAFVDARFGDGFLGRGHHAASFARCAIFVIAAIAPSQSASVDA
jgi:hypothetical protein